MKLRDFLKSIPLSISGLVLTSTNESKPVNISFENIKYDRKKYDARVIKFPQFSLTVELTRNFLIPFPDGSCDVNKFGEYVMLIARAISYSDPIKQYTDPNRADLSTMKFESPIFLEKDLEEKHWETFVRFCYETATEKLFEVKTLYGIPRKVSQKQLVQSC